MNTASFLWNGTVGSPFELDITVRDADLGTERVYMTDELLSDVGANTIRGRGTRVWKVHEVPSGGSLSAKARVLKDTWIDSDHVREGKTIELTAYMPHPTLPDTL